MSDSLWANFVQQYKKVPNKNYDKNWKIIDGTSTIDEAASTINQATNRGHRKSKGIDLAQPNKKLMGCLLVPKTRLKISSVKKDTFA